MTEIVERFRVLLKDGREGPVVTLARAPGDPVPKRCPSSGRPLRRLLECAPRLDEEPETWSDLGRVRPGP